VVIVMLVYHTHTVVDTKQSQVVTKAAPVSLAYLAPKTRLALTILAAFVQTKIGAFHCFLNVFEDLLYVY